MYPNTENANTINQLKEDMFAQKLLHLFQLHLLIKYKLLAFCRAVVCNTVAVT